MRSYLTQHAITLGTVFLVADSSKFERKAPARIGSLAEVDVFFTDTQLPTQCVDFCERAGTKIVYAESDPETNW